MTLDACTAGPELPLHNMYMDTVIDLQICQYLKFGKPFKVLTNIVKECMPEKNIFIFISQYTKRERVNRFESLLVLIPKVAIVKGIFLAGRRQHRILAVPFRDMIWASSGGMSIDEYSRLFISG